MIRSTMNGWRLSRFLLAVGAILIASMALAGSALAKEPTKGFSVFKQCPRFTPGVNFCLFGQVTGGEVTIGSTTVPIEHTITLQGGYEANENTEPESFRFFGAVNGETLSKTPQNVPGGLLDLVNCKEIKGEGLLEKAARDSCEWVFENSVTGVKAVTELAKPASEIGINTNNLLNGEGTALSLPVKIKLENSLLGGECYIGSSSSPIVIPFTTGTTSPPPPNKPITGNVGKLNFLEEYKIIEITNNKLVENAFAVPAATGCGGIFSFLIDPIIDSKLGLPSAAGHNTAIQTGTDKIATAKNVIASEM